MKFLIFIVTVRTKSTSCLTASQLINFDLIRSAERNRALIWNCRRMNSPFCLWARAGNAKDCVLPLTQWSRSGIGKCVCLSLDAIFRIVTNQRAYSFWEKWLTFDQSMARQTFSFCPLFTILFPTLVWKRSLPDCL